jgi:EAL domain-containing protein (putative c-di-GMP-specific phosphodiesterase class I)
MEALVRFITPKKGLISPLSFIPVAEETGQIVEIGEVVLNKACRDMKRWVDTKLFEGRVAVNLSARQFSVPNLCERIDVILQANELPSYHLELEITEGTVMDSPTDAIDTMNKLRSRGIHLAMDDFGTGYSSLAYLKRFPLNTLKVDKAFVDDIMTPEGHNMVATIVTIAHNLGMSVVAEGVEEQEQLDKLKALNCETIQGYYYSKPLSSKEFEQYLYDERGKKPTLSAVGDAQ